MNGLGRNYDLTILYMLPLINGLPKIKVNNHTNLLFSLQYFHKHRFCPEQFNFVYSKLFLISSGKFHTCLFSRNQLQILISPTRSSNNGVREDEDYFSSSSWKGCCIYSCILWQNWQWIQKQAVWPSLRNSWERLIVIFYSSDIFWIKSVVLHQSCVWVIHHTARQPYPHHCHFPLHPSA